MKNALRLALPNLVLLGALTAAAAPKKQVPVWTDAKKAAAEHPDFLLQGEYKGKREGATVGVQAADINNGKFLVSIYQGGLPGDGQWGL